MSFRFCVLLEVTGRFLAYLCFHVSFSVEHDLSVSNSQLVYCMFMSISCVFSCRFLI